MTLGIRRWAQLELITHESLNSAIDCVEPRDHHSHRGHASYKAPSVGSSKENELETARNRWGRVHWLDFVRHCLLTRPDVEIINFDKLTYAGNTESLADITADQRYQFVRGDISDREIVNEILSAVRFDALVNFAAERMWIAASKTLLPSFRRTSSARIASSKLHGALILSVSCRSVRTRFMAARQPAKTLRSKRLSIPAARTPRAKPPPTILWRRMRTPMVSRQ